jgi:type I restriction enzyme M protein
VPRGRKQTDKTQGSNGNGANLGFEQTLWAAADKMRGHMDAAEYKHVALGLIFLKYISDAFQELYDDLARRADTDYTDPEDRDEYRAHLRSLELSGNLERTLLYCNPHGLFQ